MTCPWTTVLLPRHTASLPATPQTEPHCAGRAAFSHDRTQMVQARDGWRCPVCGELAEDKDAET
jgi:hypothetical protein